MQGWSVTSGCHSVERSRWGREEHREKIRSALQRKPTGEMHLMAKG